MIELAEHGPVCDGYDIVVLVDGRRRTIHSPRALSEAEVAALVASCESALTEAEHGGLDDAALG